MNILANIAIAVVSSAIMFIAGVNLPASNFSLSKFTDPVLGAFTEISTATNLADFPTTYNANLNKTIEVGTTSVASITTLSGLTSASALANVGTIISGIWNGTAVGVAYGGTGTTSPTSNQVMLGNGSSGFKVIGFGTSGQFLTSGGAATAPSWTTSVIDTALDYNFTGSAFRVKNLHASSTAANPITLNGLSYSTPSGRAASSTVLSENGSGSLSWVLNRPIRYTYATTTDISVTAGSVDTTLFTIPAGVITASSTIEISGAALVTDGGTDGACSLAIKDSAGNTFVSGEMMDAISGGPFDVTFSVLILMNNAVNSQVTTLHSVALTAATINASRGGEITNAESTSSIDFANSISIKGTITSEAATQALCTLKEMTMVVNP